MLKQYRNLTFLLTTQVMIMSIKSSLKILSLVNLIGLSTFTFAEQNTIIELQYDADGSPYKSLFLRAEDSSWGTSCDSPFVFVNSNDDAYETIEKLAIAAYVSGRSVKISDYECATASNGGTYPKIKYITVR